MSVLFPKLCHDEKKVQIPVLLNLLFFSTSIAVRDKYCFPGTIFSKRVFF
jgi:hypothetical protein